LQKFGSAWTSAKLDALDAYLDAYTKIMKNQSFKICYIDAFSGSGNIIVKTGQELDGSAIRSLKYPFDRYYFFDTDPGNCEALKKE